MCYYAIVRCVIAVDVASYKTVSEEKKKEKLRALHIPHCFN